MCLQRCRQAGQMVPILAVLLVALMGFVALGLDAGRAFGDSRSVQNAADGAALAGAEDVAKSTHDPNYRPNKARMDAMVYLARNLGIMGLLGSVTCGDAAMTPNYTAIPAGYGSNIDTLDCGLGGTVSTPITIGAYQVTIYQPPLNGPHSSPPDAYAIEVDLTHYLPTTVAGVLGFTQLPITQHAVAGSVYPRSTFAVLQHFSVNPTALTLNAATVDVVNGDIADNGGVTTNGTSTINWWYCAPRSYGGGDPATDPACNLTSDQYLYRWYQATASFSQNPNNPIKNLVVYMQDPNYPQPASVLGQTTPDCSFQPGGSQAAYYNGGVVTVPVLAAGQTFHIPPGAYKQIVVPAGFAGTVILDPTITTPCPNAAGNNQNSDKLAPYGFLLGSPGQNQRAIDMTMGGTMVGNGVFLLVQAPGSTANSNQLGLNSGAQFFINGRSDIFGYTGPGCITAPVNQNAACALAQPSPWCTTGPCSGTNGDPISITVSYQQGATASSPNGGTKVIAFNSGTTSDVQGMIYAPDDNVTIAGGVQGSGVGRVIAYTVTFSSNNGKIIEEYASTAPVVFGLFS
jgi:putative Flp pilus-assembly TadE/G-like protein